MGLGLSGEAAARFLVGRGAKVVASESRDEAALGSLPSELRALGAVVECGPHRGGVFEGCEIVVLSPGVPPRQEALERARASGARVVSEVELASWYLEGKIVGITGSNGKSTVTALSAAILNESGVRARPCGNIGLPLIAMAGGLRGEMHVKDLGRSESFGNDAPDAVYVVEASSFQLEGIETFHPAVAALLNLSPDHQDRYDRAEDYYAAKARIFMNQKAGDVAVLNADDPPTWSLAREIRSRIVPFSVEGKADSGVLVTDGRLIRIEDGAETFLMDVSEVPLRGRHNLENVAASAAVALSMGGKAAAVRRAVGNFQALPHRLKFVGEVRGAAVYDDSKATNVGSTIRALEAFESPIVLLLGGRDKGGDFLSLIPHLKRCARAVVTFGEAGADIAERLTGEVPVIRGGPLAEAVRAAIDASRAGDVVLLAPACASFDAYSGYAARGDHFTRIVREIAASEARN